MHAPCCRSKGRPQHLSSIQHSQYAQYSCGRPIAVFGAEGRRSLDCHWQAPQWLSRPRSSAEAYVDLFMKTNIENQLQDRRRRAERVSRSAPIRLSWTQGYDKYGMGQCLNISRTGLAMLISEPLPVRGHVCFRSETLGLCGTASVRYCQSHKAKYLIGLDFAGGLQWDPELDDVEVALV